MCSIPSFVHHRRREFIPPSPNQFLLCSLCFLPSSFINSSSGYFDPVRPKSRFSYPSVPSPNQ